MDGVLVERDPGGRTSTSQPFRVLAVSGRYPQWVGRFRYGARTAASCSIARPMEQSWLSRSVPALISRPAGRFRSSSLAQIIGGLGLGTFYDVAPDGRFPGERVRRTDVTSGHRRAELEAGQLIVQALANAPLHRHRASRCPQERRVGRCVASERRHCACRAGRADSLDSDIQPPHHGLVPRRGSRATGRTPGRLADAAARRASVHPKDWRRRRLSSIRSATSDLAGASKWPRRADRRARAAARPTGAAWLRARGPPVFSAPDHRAGQRRSAARCTSDARPSRGSRGRYWTV